MSKILILGLNFHPELTGIGKYTGELAAYLASQGHQVRVITTPPYYPHWQVQPGYHAWKYQSETWQGVEVQRCPVWVPRRPSGLTRLIHIASFAFSSLPALIAQLRWRPALVMCIAPAMLNAPFALAFARLSGAKAWLHIQDFELDAALKLGLVRGGQWLARLSARLERALLLGFDMVSTISGTMLRRLHEKGLPQNKTFLFRNWVDTRQIFPLEEDDNPLRAGLGLASGQLAVLYAGAIGRKQGLENLLAAAGRLQDRPQLQFIVCGDGAARPEIEAAARGMSNIHFLPVQPAERLNRLLNLADIHVLPQKASAADLVMPSKLGGMLASGKAVIATACSKTELGQIVGQVGETVPPEDAESLAEAIASLANEPAKRQRLGMLGRKYACDHLEKEVVLSALEGAFEGLLADRARAQCPRIGQLTPSI